MSTLHLEALTTPTIRNGKGTTRFPFPTSKNMYTTTNKLESTNYLTSLHI